MVLLSGVKIVSGYECDKCACARSAQGEFSTHPGISMSMILIIACQTSGGKEGNLIAGEVQVQTK